MKYFINADDFGETPGKTAAIHEALVQGWIQRASLMVNMDATEQAMGLAAEHNYKDKIFFHLNLGWGDPLTEDVKHTALCDASGRFCWASLQSIQLHCMSPRTIRAIRAECEAQMRAFRDNGFSSNRMDSHIWLLASLPVWLAVKPLLKKYGFTQTRTLAGHRINVSSRLMRIYYRTMAAVIKTALTCPEDWSGCCSELLDAVSQGVLTETSVAELYVHPNTVDGVSTDTVYSYTWQTKPVSEVASIAARVGQLLDA